MPEIHLPSNLAKISIAARAPLALASFVKACRMMSPKSWRAFSHPWR